MFWRVPPRAGAAAPGRISTLMPWACDFHPHGCKMAVAPPGTASAFQLGRRGSKKRERERERERCVPVCLLLSGRQQFPGSPTSFTLVDTLLATIGDVVISSNLGIWGGSVLTSCSELEVRWRGGGYCVEQPMLAKVWLNKISSYSFSFLPFQCALAMEEFKAGLIHLYVHSQLTWRSVLCLAWLGTGSKLNKTAMAWGPLDPTV